MGRSRGSVSIAVLAAALLLLLFAQLFLLYAGREYEKHVRHVRAEQLRQLCVSAMESLTQKDVPAGSRQWLTGKLYPGGTEAVVSSKLSTDADGYVSCLEVTTECGDERQRLRRTEFLLPESMQAQAHECGIISGADVMGAEFLPPETLYAGKREVSFPQADACASWAIEELPMETLRLNGLSKRFYYLDDYRGLTFDNNMKISGSALIAAQGSITISNRCQFSDPVVILSEQKIVIEDGVKMPQALLLARKGIRIGSGCSIAGVLISDGNIEFTDFVDFTYDGSLVAGFTSVYYIL